MQSSRGQGQHEINFVPPPPSFYQTSPGYVSASSPAAATVCAGPVTQDSSYGSNVVSLPSASYHNQRSPQPAAVVTSPMTPVYAYIQENPQLTAGFTPHATPMYPNIYQPSPPPTTFSWSPPTPSATKHEEPPFIKINDNIAVRRTGHSGPLAWDVSHNPSAYDFPKIVLAQQVTSPPSRRLAVWINEIHYPWYIQVEAHASPYVTVGDFLRAVYRDLRVSVSKTEFNKLNSEHRGYIESAYHQRKVSHPDAPGSRNQGIRRLDYLRNLTTFKGVNSMRPGYINNGQLEGPILELFVGRRLG